MAFQRKFEWTLAILQIFFIVMFALFFEYGDDLVPKLSVKNDSASENEVLEENSLPKYYPMFQDVNAIIFIGVAFLYAFLGKYSYTGIGMTILIAAIGTQWGIICSIWWKDTELLSKTALDITSLIKGEFSAGVAVIALGGIFGKVSRMQILGFTIIVVLVYTTVNNCCQRYLKSFDSGESVALHLFAAVFGCATAYTMDRKKAVQENPNGKPSLNSNVFCLIGTILLWTFWPSFNSSMDEGNSQHRSVLNTYFAMLGGLISVFMTSSFLHKEGKFNMSHVQNASLAGGVAIAATCSLLVQPYGALLIGTIAGCISVTGFQYLSPFLAKIQIYDPCGINSLHGLPGLFGGLIGVITALLADEENYGYSLYKYYPAMAPEAHTTAFLKIHEINPDINPGLNWTSGTQACFQILYIVINIVVATIAGLLTGWLLQCKCFDPLEEKQMYTDETYWTDIPESNVNPIKQSNTDQESETKESHQTSPV